MTAAGGDFARAAWAQAWQVTLLIVAVALLTRLAARNRPHLAHALWLVVLVKCVTPPLWSSPGGVFCWMRAGPAVESADALLSSSSHVLPRALLEPPMPGLPGSVTSGMTDHNAAGPWQSDRVVMISPTEREGGRGPAVSSIEANAAATRARARRTAALFGGWALGTLAMLGVAAVRWVGCLRLIRRCHASGDGPCHLLIARLSRRLRLRRPARLVITQSRVGPAVMGLFRPVVVLPEIVVQGKSPEDLEPLLSHELIHVRRGDMWVGALQVLAQAVWWFHPLVWWTSRSIAREAERCCDEAVLAELGCTPARYARSLLDVLERKRSLKPVPALPGVRPLEVTSRRLERIMRLGHGSHKRSPWWCWVVMLVAAVVTLPGAAMVVAAGDGAASGGESGDETSAPARLQPVGESRPEASWELLSAWRARWESLTARLGKRDLRRVDADASAARGTRRLAGYCSAEPPLFLDEHLAADAPADPAKNQTVRVYQVAHLLAALQSELGLSETKAKETLTEWLAGAVRSEDMPGNGVTWSEGRLVVRAGPAAQALVAAWLESMRQCGFDQILIEARFFTGPPNWIDSIGANWTVLPAQVPAEERPPAPFGTAGPSRIGPPLPDDVPPQPGQAKVVVEKSLPVMYEILDEERAKTILDRMQADRQANVLTAPKVMLLNGQSGFISDCSQSPFVVGVEDGKPQVRVVSEGLQVRLRPLVEDEKKLRLDCGLTLSNIRGVETTSIARGPYQGSLTLQIPEVETTRWDASVELPVGKTLMIGGLETKDDRGKPQSMLVMFRAERIPVSRTVAREPELYQMVYDVADLVVPYGLEKVVIAASYDEPAPKPQAADPDFESLILLIETTVAPETWDDVGGPGSIAPFETNLSLVVSQTREVHEEIADLLEQVRRGQDVQVILETEIVRAPEDVLRPLRYESVADGNHKTLAPREARRFRAVAGLSHGVSILRLPIAKLFNGQPAVVAVSGKPDTKTEDLDKLSVQCVIAKDRRSVRVTCGVNFEHAVAVAVGDGRTLLVDVTEWLHAADGITGVPVAEGSRVFRRTPSEGSTVRTLVLLTPKIVVKEEEEERLAPLE